MKQVNVKLFNDKLKALGDKALARLELETGLSRSTLESVKHGRCPNEANQKLIANALKTPINKLFLEVSDE